VASGEHATAPPGHLLENMVLFGRLLRVGGLDVTPTQITDWLAGLDRIDLRRKGDFRAASRAILVRRHDDLPWFEAAFDLFWQARDPRELADLELGLLLQRTTRETARKLIEEAGGRDDGDAERDTHETAVYSDREALRHRDFAELSGDELRAVRELMASMRWRLSQRRTRRTVGARRGPAVDLRRTLRRNLSRGGELLKLARRRRKLHRRPLVLLCDISGSMEPYSRLLLHFIYAVAHGRSAEAGLDRVEAFVFGTRLTRITRELRHRDVDRALREAARQIEDWGGGTRTGEALEELNYLWSRRVLGRGAVVLVISDGWDRGDVELLGHEIERLHRSCYRLIWLNPLLGSPSYEPLTRGMQAALPHLDHFLPVHNLQSLEQLAALLEGISA
jgi:hypothetical protein